MMAPSDDTLSIISWIIELLCIVGVLMNWDRFMDWLDRR